MAGITGRFRVAVVDDDPWLRRGRAALLAEQEHFEVEMFSPEQALAMGDAWGRFDAALVDAFERSERFDQFVGVEVVEAIRSRRSSEETFVVVVSSYLDNQLLRLRLLRAGADVYYQHEDLYDPAVLVAVLTGHLRGGDGRGAGAAAAAMGTRPVRTGEALRHLPPGADPSELLRYLDGEGYAPAFEPDLTQRALGLSRRSLLRIRSEVARRMGLVPQSSAGRAGGSTLPEWRVVVSFVNRARGLPESGEDIGTRGPIPVAARDWTR